MRETQAIIERVRQIGTGRQHLELAVEDSALANTQPGQTFLARLDQQAWEPYLRENWVVVDVEVEDAVLVVERPLTHRYAPGDVVNILGPVGAPFPLRTGIRQLLLVAQDYAPTRFMYLLTYAIRQGIGVTLVLTGEAQSYPLGVLPPIVEVINSDDPLLWPDYQQVLRWADQIFVVTAPLFVQERYRALWDLAQDARRALPEQFLYGVFDLPLPCGTGACMACMVRCKAEHRLVCTDSAAIDLSIVRLE